MLPGVRAPERVDYSSGFQGTKPSGIGGIPQPYIGDHHPSRPFDAGFYGPIKGVARPRENSYHPSLAVDTTMSAPSNGVSVGSLLFLDTKHSLRPNSPASTEWVLNSSSFNDISNYTLIVQNVAFPNIVPPINQYNNKISFIENGVAPTLIATLPTRAYTGTEFADAIATAMNDVGSLNYTVTYDTTTKKLTVTTTTPASTFQFVSVDQDAYDEMGYQLPIGNSVTHIGSVPVRLDGSLYVDVQTNISCSNYSSNGKTNILTRVPLNAPFGSINFWENSTDDYIQLSNYDIFNLEIILRDDKGNIFDLPFNANVFYTMKLSPI